MLCTAKSLVAKEVDHYYSLCYAITNQWVGRSINA